MEKVRNESNPNLASETGGEKQRAVNLMGELWKMEKSNRFCAGKRKSKREGVEVGIGRDCLVIGKVKENGETVKENPSVRVRVRAWECDRRKMKRNLIGNVDLMEKGFTIL